MDRIIILGCAGSGKTTLARQLAERTGSPVISLDALWQPHWKEKDLPTFRTLVMQAHSADRWISDGNFAQVTFDIRLPRATLVIWLECSRFLCVWRAISRVFKQDELHRIEKLGDVLVFIWKFNRVNRPRIEAIRAAHGPNVPVRRLNSSRQITTFLSSCGNDVDG